MDNITPTSGFCPQWKKIQSAFMVPLCAVGIVGKQFFFYCKRSSECRLNSERQLRKKFGNTRCPADLLRCWNVVDERNIFPFFMSTYFCHPCCSQILTWHTWTHTPKSEEKVPNLGYGTTWGACECSIIPWSNDCSSAGYLLAAALNGSHKNITPQVDALIYAPFPSQRYDLCWRTLVYKYFSISLCQLDDFQALLKQRVGRGNWSKRYKLNGTQ